MQERLGGYVRWCIKRRGESCLRDSPYSGSVLSLMATSCDRLNNVVPSAVGIGEGRVMSGKWRGVLSITALFWLRDRGWLAYEGGRRCGSC